MTEFTHVRLKDYPFATVRFACIRCDRQGMLQRSELIARHGPEISMLELRELITDCKPRRGTPCGAYYPDFAAG